MHELSLVEDMRELILARAAAEGFSKVEKVWLEVGELSCVEAEAMAFCFASVMAGTPVEGAVLEIVPIPGKGHCQECDQISAISQLFDACPVCGSFGLQLLQGREVRVRSLAVI